MRLWKKIVGIVVGIVGGNEPWVISTLALATFSILLGIFSWKELVIAIIAYAAFTLVIGRIITAITGAALLIKKYEEFLMTDIDEASNIAEILLSNAMLHNVMLNNLLLSWILVGFTKAILVIATKVAIIGSLIAIPVIIYHLLSITNAIITKKLQGLKGKLPSWKFIAIYYVLVVLAIVVFINITYQNIPTILS